MKYKFKILMLALTSMGWATNMNAHTVANSNVATAPDDDNKTEVNIENELPEGMTDREIDSLYNEWAVKNFLSEEECDPKNVNPEFSDEVYADRLARLQVLVSMPYNDVVRKYIDRYADRMRRSVSIMLGASNFYNPIFEEALESYQMPLELKYLPVIESALNPSSTSKAGAAGLWQFMVGTGKSYNLEVTSLIDERRDPIKSSYAAAHYLKDLYGIFGDWTLCLAAYNCGPGNVTKAIKRAGGETDFWSIYPYLPNETRGYVPAFIAATYIMNYYCEHNICPAATRLPASSDTIMINRDINMSEIVKCTGIDMEELKALNPQYRTNLIPGHSHACSLRLPTTAVSAFLEAGEKVYANNGRSNAHREVAVTDQSSNDRNSSKREVVVVRKEEPKKEVVKREVVVRKEEPKKEVVKKEVKKEEPKKEVKKEESKKETAKKESAKKEESKKESSKKESSKKESSKKESTKKESSKKETNKKETAKKSNASSNKTATVKDGDNLSKIAKRNGTTVEKLKKDNGLKSDMIKPGQVLKIKK